MGTKIWPEVERAAAHQFGKRHYRGILAFLIFRRAAPFVLLAGMLAALAWWLARTVHAALLVPFLAPAIAALAALVLGIAGWRRYGDTVGSYAPVPATVAVGGFVLLAAAGAGLVTWLV